MHEKKNVSREYVSTEYKPRISLILHRSASDKLACVQTSPISFVARGKGTSACNKGNRRRLHAGK